MTDMDELVLWLREQIAETRVLAELVRDTWAVESGYEKIRSAVKQVANRESVLAQCDAHEAILDRVVPLVTDLEDKVDSEWGSGDPYEGADEVLLKTLALAYQHRPGYCQEWRPSGGL